MRRPSRTRIVPILALGILQAALAPQVALATSLWNEAVDGDISGDRLLSPPSGPTSVQARLGVHSLIATSVSNDREYITLHLPPGGAIESIVLVDYTPASGDITAFIGFQAGTSMTVAANASVPTGLLGYTHFGTGPGNVGDDIIPALQASELFGADGFTLPLNEPSYTFWIQQTGSAATYRFDFTIVPEPGGIALVALGAVFSLVIARRRRRPAIETSKV
jgi:hypothetical protein